MLPTQQALFSFPTGPTAAAGIPSGYDFCLAPVTRFAGFLPNAITRSESCIIVRPHNAFLGAHWREPFYYAAGYILERRAHRSCFRSQFLLTYARPVDLASLSRADLSFRPEPCFIGLFEGGDPRYAMVIRWHSSPFYNRDLNGQLKIRHSPQQGAKITKSLRL